MTLPFGLLDIPREQGLFGLPTALPREPLPTRPRGPSIFDRIGAGVDRLLGLPRDVLSEEERRFAKSQGLLGLGSSLLRAAGPTRDPVSVAQALGQAIPQAQAATLAGLQTRFALGERAAQRQAAQARQEAIQQLTQGPDINLSRVATGLVQRGLLDEAGEIADIASKLEQEGARLIPRDMPDGSVAFFHPTRGDLVNLYRPDQRGGFVPLSKENQAFVNTVQADFERSTRSVNESAAANIQFQAAAEDLRQAFEAGDREAAAAASDMLITQFVRMGEPLSVVRDPEFRRAAGSGSFATQIERLIERFFTGTVPIQSLNSLTRQARFQLRAQRDIQRRLMAPQQRRLRDRGLPIELLQAPDFFSPIDFGVAPAPFVTPGTVPPGVGERIMGGVRRIVTPHVVDIQRGLRERDFGILNRYKP